MGTGDWGCEVILLAFELSMPSRSSWNGKWSGDGAPYVLVRRVADSNAGLVGCHFYNWSDGWCAMVAVRMVSGDEARKLRRKSAGFSGYDWMVSSLLLHGAIYASHDKIPELAKPQEGGAQ